MKKFTFLTLALICAIVANAATVYLKPGKEWTKNNERYAVYTWDVTPEWYDMTLEEPGIYKAELPNGVTNVIFCRMNGATTENNWSNKWDQTNDLKLTGTNNLYTISSKTGDKYTGSWSVYTPSTVTSSFTVYLLKSSTSWSNAYIYAWDANNTQITKGWPGTAMGTKTVDGYEYFYYTLELRNNVQSVNIIFNNGSEQTVDITNVTKDTYYELDVKDNGKYIVRSYDVPTAIEEIDVDGVAVEYYNLQGVKVANPENGIFIRKQGAKTTKVVL